MRMSYVYVANRQSTTSKVVLGNNTKMKKCTPLETVNLIKVRLGTAAERGGVIVGLHAYPRPFYRSVWLKQIDARGRRRRATAANKHTAPALSGFLGPCAHGFFISCWQSEPHMHHLFSIYMPLSMNSNERCCCCFCLPMTFSVSPGRDIILSCRKGDALLHRGQQQF